MSETNNTIKNKKNQYHHLTKDDRTKIQSLIEQIDETGKRIFSNSYIADYIGVHKSTISRELKRIKSKINIRTGKITNKPYNAEDAQNDYEFKRAMSKANYILDDFSKFKNIKVLSDAGTWIVNGIQNLKLYPENEIIHCLCEFHVKQKINRITKNENLVRLLVQYIINDNKKDFISLIGTITKDKDDKRRKTIEGYKNYLIKYWTAFKNMLNSKIRSSMESHISHNVAKYFSFEPKAFSKRRIQKLIKLQEYKANGINILGLYLKSYNNTAKITLKKEELNFDIFNKSSSNLPILYSGDTPTRLALKGLSC